MADLTVTQMFGQRAELNTDPDPAFIKLLVDLADFQNTTDGGQIENDLGITNLEQKSDDFTNNSNKGITILYAIFLLILQNQAENINADPEQKIFITENPVRLGSGSRSGQIQRSFTVNFFSEGSITSRPDIDDITNSNSSSNGNSNGNDLPPDGSN